MRLKVISSGSIGNSYLIYNNTEALIIECGVAFDRIKKALNFDLSKVVGCLVSHSHKDHCKGVKDLVSGGIDVYCLKETSDRFGFFSHRFNDITPGKTFTLGNFTIVSFDLDHDVPCLGFYIKHAETGNFCFITDTYLCEATFPDLNNIIVEANYCTDILQSWVTAGKTIDMLRDRVITSHMSIETCKEFLAANDLRKVHNIILIHLSDKNSNAERFKKEVKEQTTKTVHIAEAGLDILFNKTPF